MKKVLNKMTEKVNNLEERVKQCEKRVKETENNHSKDLEQIIIEQNRQAQYSRKDNIRIFGKEEKAKEDCKTVVCDFINKALGIVIIPADISAAHRLPKTGKQKYKPIIVRLKDSIQRQDILKNRKKLKGSGVSISEVYNAEKSGCFASVWFAYGKVKGTDKKGQRHTLNLFENFQKMFEKTGRKM
jgi:hypothetical protein